MLAGGSVHAVDAEMALQSAHDVYGRRPTSVGLWAVPRSAIYTKTRDELENFSPAADGHGREEMYCVFQRCQGSVVYEEAKTVRAASAEQALACAVAQAAGHEVHAWWVFPASAIISSESRSEEPSLNPRPNKWFRDQKSFPVLTLLRRLRSAKEKDAVSDTDES
jgi:1,2-phenylacetyl-CoA epoxidase PaaB subunit